MPPSLPSYLIRALRYSSVNIRKIGTWPPGCLLHTEFLYANEVEVTSKPHLHTNEHEAMQPVWRIGKYLNFPPLISQRSYQTTSLMRWYPLAPDKTFLQLKGFDKIPTDNGEIWGKPSP